MAKSLAKMVYRRSLKKRKTQGSLAEDIVGEELKEE
jgi:hypothetical protein